MQHNAFSWEVKGSQFVHEQGLDRISLGVNKTVRAWLEQLSTEERSKFVETLFESIRATGASTVGELSKEKMALASAMLKTYKNLTRKPKPTSGKASICSGAKAAKRSKKPSSRI